jgi:hypothetical protein
LPTHHSPEVCPFRRVSGLVHGLALFRHGPQEVLVSNLSMHFGYYLMIAALVLMGLEVLYALYQLATFL